MIFFRYLELFWFIAALAGLGLAIYNLFHYSWNSHHVYFPLFCCGFCLLLNYNLRSYRRFREKRNSTPENPAE